MTRANINNGVDQSRKDSSKNSEPEAAQHDTENEDSYEEPIEEDIFEDEEVLIKESEEYEHLYKQQKTTHKTGEDSKEVEQKESDSDEEGEDAIDEGTIEVLFDSGEVKITKKLANGDVLQLPSLKMTLGTPETDIEDEMVDTPIEEDVVIEEEEGDGMILTYPYLL